MRKNDQHIPVNTMTENSGQGISIDKISLDKPDFKHSHRDDGYTFHIIEKGVIHIEIDFQKYEIHAPSVVYMHPNQVHRILDFEKITVCSLSVKDENLNPDYLKLLEEIAPAKPLELTNETNSTLSDIFRLCYNFSIQKNNKLHYSLLKDSCNTLVAFLISQFLDQNKPESNFSRFEIVAKSFKLLLEKNYCNSKSPSGYADQLNISTSYLNECVKNTTGSSVSQHIKNRVVLEAKRMLYHSEKSIKEISFELGYDDHSYFSRLFTKAAGISALAFQNKNHE
ncbi:AraC family transcriptional regulator [Chryseobacterium sp. 3008163]|uniref:AraC family transcriptional regulator n=1 Tax=Chryseobacterium sp. 3008163 TaxID=2478663 RepID=UPI0013E9C0D1|nr:helix-turn-helix transcriptional regulator [Chryseobacterium sp. 3008163]